MRQGGPDFRRQETIVVVKGEKSVPLASLANSSRGILSATDDVIDVAVDIRRSTALLSSEEEDSENTRKQPTPGNTSI